MQQLGSSNVLPIKFLPVFFLIFVSCVEAKELTQVGENVRSFGMGGVRIGSEHDAHSFIANPAHLRFVKGFNWRIIGLDAGIDGLQVYNDVKNANINGLNSISNFYGEHIWLGINGESAMSFPYFGIGAYDNIRLEAMLHNPALPELEMTYLNDLAFLTGVAIPISDEGGLGMNVKRINRLGGPNIIGVNLLNNATSSTLIDQFQNQGIGYGMDLGALYQIKAPFSPTLSLAWQDVGTTAFARTQGLDAPDRIKDNLTAGFSVESHVTGLGIGAGMEYRHINDADEQFGKKIHVGMELSLPIIDLRGGYYQGYPSLGVGVNLWLMQLDAAVYTVERGAYTGQSGEQRIEVGVAMDFSLDPDLSLNGANGRHRHLKQRR